MLHRVMKGAKAPFCFLSEGQALIIRALVWP